MFAVGTLLVLANYPGNKLRSEPRTFWLAPLERYRVEHGWPWNYRTEVQWVLGKHSWQEEKFVDLSELSLWSWSFRDSEMHWLALAGDLLVAAVVLAGCYWFVAKDRLRFALLLRGKFALIHLLLVTTLVSGGLVFWREWQYRQNWKVLSEELWNRIAQRASPAPDFPIWFRQLFGDENLVKLGWNLPRVKLVDFQELETFEEDDVLGHFLAKYPEGVLFSMYGDWSQHYQHFPRIESLLGSGVTASEGQLRLLAQSPNIRMLSLSGVYTSSADKQDYENIQPFTEKEARYLHLLKNLEHLEIPEYVPITAEAIHEIAKLPKLYSMRLRHWDLTPEARLALGELTQLKLLYIDANGMKSGDLKPIGKLTKLEALQLRYADIDDSDLAELANCRDLRWLDVQNSRIGNQGLRPLLNHPRLCFLETFESKVGDNALPVLETLSELRVLDCRDGRLRHIDNFRLDKLPRLKVFSFSANYISYRTQKVLDKKFPHLRIINPGLGLAGHDQFVVDLDFPNCFDERDPQAMNLASFDINDEALQLFAKEVAAGRLQFRKLWLTGADLTDASIPVLNQFQQVEELRLFHTPLTAAGIAQLKGFPRLKNLVLDPTHLSAASVANLKQFPSLERVLIECRRDRCPEKQAALENYKAQLPQLE